MDDSKNSPTHSVHIVEEKSSVEHAQPLYNNDVDTSAIDERKLLRKVDLRLIPWFAVLYLLSFLDRTSIGNLLIDPGLNVNAYWALIASQLYNLERDLNISDNQYLISLTIFFISYAIFEVPSNIFLKRLKPSAWFAFLMTLQGVAKNFGGLIGNWYKRSELGIRTALFTSATTLSGAFGGLLAAAISNMDGIGGRPAWSWIFILEGLVTILAGIASYWIVQDFPETATFLTETERTFMIRRLQGDDQFSAAGEKLRIRNILASFRDWKTCCDMPLYAFSLFTPSIINQVSTPANLLTVPIYAFAAIVTCCVALYADKHGRRGAVGYIILIVSRNAALSYFAVFVATCRFLFRTWIANNFEGSYKRGVSIAMGISMGNLNGAVSSNVYRARDRPWYALGHGLVLMYICIAIAANSVFLYLLKLENARRDRGERDEVIGAEGSEDNGNGVYATVEDAKREKGDNWSGYRYML
ncbi:major facilitator superfamily domain-containing protein [Mycena crocata]|nr:major facilitator superfamily domain-containing protein [Mycena crocata]